VRNGVVASSCWDAAMAMPGNLLLVRYDGEWSSSYHLIGGVSSSFSSSALILWQVVQVTLLLPFYPATGTWWRSSLSIFRSDDGIVAVVGATSSPLVAKVRRSGSGRCEQWLGEVQRQWRLVQLQWYQMTDSAKGWQISFSQQSTTFFPTRGGLVVVVSLVGWWWGPSGGLWWSVQVWAGCREPQ
jgi:hypothetical protein